MSRSLVTGGAGFIGSHIVEALLVRGDQVRVLDNFSSGKEENLADFQDKIELITGDIRDHADLVSALKDVDFVFHQAAFVSSPLSINEPDQCFGINVDGTIQLFAAALKEGVNRVVIASSAAVYGNNPAVPLGEELSLEPLTPYATSKVVAELYTKLYSELLGLDVVALRYFNVFGPRQNPESEYAAVIPIFIKSLLEDNQPIIYGSGHQTRDFIFIGDIVRANLIASESELAAGKVFNICSGVETTLLELIEHLAKIFGRDIRPQYQKERPGDIFRSAGNPTLAREMMDFAPNIDLAQGLEETLAWMDQS